MKRLWIMLIITLVSMSAGCRNGIVEPPETPTIPDYEIIVDIPEGKEGISLALQSLAELGGGTLTLSEGVFVIDAPIQLISNMILQGQGENTVIKLADGFNEGIIMIRGNGVSNVVVRNLVVDGNKAEQASGEQHGIFFENSNNITVENVTVKNCKSNGLTFGTNTKNCIGDNIQLINNSIGARLTQFSIIVDSHIYDNDVGLYLFPSDGITVSNCFVYNNNGTGITAGHGSRGINITNNRIYANGTNGLRLRGISNSKIHDNEIYLNGYGGIYGEEDHVYNTENNSIKGNIIHSNNQSGAAYSNIELFNFCIGNVVQGNTLRRGDEANKPKYGIYISWTTSERNLINDNDLYLSGTDAAIRDDGTNTNFGAGNRVNDGSWIVGEDYTP